LAVWLTAGTVAGAETAGTLFQDGTKSYQVADYARASRAFRKSAALQLASGTLQSLGNAEWQRGEVGAAILAWEQALWVDGFNHAARQNLSYARKAAELEPPEVSWHEAVSTWLPVNTWAWITGASLWLVVGMVLLPGIMRRPRAAWHQATAAVGLAVLLVSLPAHLGVQSRTDIGFILHQDTPLRLTPTAEAEVITRLRAGAPARVEKMRGNFVLIRTNRTRGWIESQQLGLICPKPVK
jgi:tetratricopeptide (TPR) repeat protein